MAQPFYAYMLRCRDGRYYVGQTDDLTRRLAEHAAGLGPRFTKKRLPVKLVWSQQFTTRDEAAKAEAQLKGWSRAKKEALIDGRFDLIADFARRGGVARTLRDAPSLGQGAPQGCGLVDRMDEE